jgi:hypothetical protein
MVRRTSGQHSGGISNGPQGMDLANLGEVPVLKVPIRPGRTEALLKLSGVRVTAGGKVLVLIASANRDRSICEHADTFDIAHKTDVPDLVARRAALERYLTALLLDVEEAFVDEFVDAEGA